MAHAAPAAGHAPAAPAAAPTQTKQDPEWIRVILVSLVLVVVLRIGFSIPILTGLTAIAVIVLGQVLYTDLKMGFEASINGLKFLGRTITGTMLFLTLRFMASDVVGIYPTDTKDALWNKGGVTTIFWGRTTPDVVMWDLLFAFVAGGLVIASINKKDGGLVKFILVFSFLVLTTKVSLPEYGQSFPSRKQVVQKIADRGWIGGALDGVKTLAFGKSAENPDSNVASEEEELLLLRFECYTPCSAPVTFPARFKYEGSILNVQYPGVTNPVSYYRNVPGTKSAPTGVLKGETFFTSGDPNNPNFRVQVFERIRR